MLHSQFGTGTVTAQTETLLTVEFDGSLIKKFIYPDVFLKLLRLSSPAKQDELDNELKEIKDRLENAKRLQAEEERKLKERLLNAQQNQKRSPILPYSVEEHQEPEEDEYEEDEEQED